jgi:hypothetical protein
MTDIDHCPRCGEYLSDEMGHMCPSDKFESDKFASLQECLETIRAALDFALP